MNISTFLEMILVVGAVFFVFAGIATDMNANYPNSQQLNNNEWNNQYNYTNQINDTIAPLQDTFSKIEDQNTGWFTKITSGIAAIPLAVIRIPFILFAAFGIGGNILTGFFSILGLPQYLILTGLIMILVWGVFKLLEAYQRWKL